MKHQVLSVTEQHPFEILKLKITADSVGEKASIMNVDEDLQNYLTLILNAVDILQASAPTFIIKRVKQNLRFTQ